MDSDITPIFEPTNDPSPQQQPLPPDPPQSDDIVDEESTPLEFVQPEPQHSYVMPPQPPQPQYYYPPPQPQAPPEIPQWDPFKNVTTSTWIILVLAFVLGFFMGKQ